MSVQVKRRRDTAANLASFTGAQAELLVDTTNNRVQVHDGATPGGWPAAKLAEVITNARTAVSDANYAALSTDRTIAFIAITAARTVNLPAAASYPTGTALTVFDESGSCSAANSITLVSAGSDTIDGAASAIISSPYGYFALQSNGANKWTIVDQAASAVAGVSSLNALSGALSISAGTGLAVSASGAAVTVANTSLPGGLINKFRNATMDVWQRGTSLTATTSGVYTADGWIVLPTGAGVAVAQASGRLLTKCSLQVTGATSVTDVIIKQRIESTIAAAFCGQTVTVQAQVYNNTGYAITPLLTVKHAGSQDVWSSPTTDVSAVSLQSCASGAWTQVAYTFSASASSYDGLEISFDFGNNFGANTKSIEITELDIRVTPGVATGLNPAPPPPELRPIATELAFCQRYFSKSYPQSTAPGTNIGNGNGSILYTTTPGSSVIVGGSMPFPVTMRATPIFAIYDNVGNSGKFSNFYNGSWTDNAAPANAIANSGAYFFFNYAGAVQNASFDYTASAEL